MKAAAARKRRRRRMIVEPILVLRSDGIVGRGVRAFLSEAGVSFQAADMTTLRQTKLTASPSVIVIASENLVHDIQTVKRSSPNARVVVASLTDDPEILRASLQAGARGIFVCAEGTAAVLRDMINAVRQGRRAVCPHELERLIESFCQNNQASIHSILTPSERELLTAAVAGASNSQLAKQFSRSRGTIKNRLTSIYRKLGVHGRLQAAARAADLTRSS